MSAKKPFKEHAAKREKGGFVPLPHAVLKSDEWCSLSPRAQKLMLDLLSQYRGDNNGDLAANWSLMSKRGWKSKETLFNAIKELKAGNWIVVARQGGRTKTPSLYAVSFYAVDYCKGKLDISPTGSPSGDWRRNRVAPPIGTLRALVGKSREKSAANPVVRESNLAKENRSAQRTSGQVIPLDRYGDRTNSEANSESTGTTAVLLSRVTTI